MKNSRATLVRGMREVLSAMSGVESYIDDLIVFFSDRKMHLQTLEELLRRLSEANLTARPSKCIFGASTVKFLGHDVGYDWITPNEDKSGQDCAGEATNHEEGSLTILRVARLLPRLHSIFCYCCSNVERHNKKRAAKFLKWSESQEKAFTTLREALLKWPILKLPDHSRDFSYVRTLSTA